MHYSGSNRRVQLGEEDLQNINRAVHDILKWQTRTPHQRFGSNPQSIEGIPHSNARYGPSDFQEAMPENPYREESQDYAFRNEYSPMGPSMEGGMRPFSNTLPSYDEGFGQGRPGQFNNVFRGNNPSWDFANSDSMRMNGGGGWQRNQMAFPSNNRSRLNTAPGRINAGQSNFGNKTWNKMRNDSNAAGQKRKNINRQPAPNVPKKQAKADKIQADKPVLGSPWKALKPSDFEDVPNKYFRCSSCNVKIADSASFHRHINNDKHLDAIKKERKASAQNIGLFRSHIKKVEESRAKNIEADKMKISYCETCRVNVVGAIGIHNVKPYHQKLKNYFCPSCPVCSIELKSRVDWENHRFSPDHLMALSKGNHPVDYVLPNDTKFVAAVKEVSKKLVKEKPVSDEKAEEVSLDGKTTDDTSNKDESRLLCGWTLLPSYQEMISDPEIALDIKEEEKGDLQEYQPDSRKVVGWEQMVPVQGFFCRCCKKAFSNVRGAKAHMSSRNHWQKYTGNLVVGEAAVEENS